MKSQSMQEIAKQLPSLTQAEILDLAARLIALARVKEGQKETDLSKYLGILKNGPDPLEYQKDIRGEWDRG